MSKIAKKRKKTLYKPAKHKKYAKIVSFKNPTQAFNSVRKLRKEYRESKTKAKKLRIARVTQYASNRARATLSKKGLSRKEQQDLRQIHGIYKTQAKSFWTRYKTIYGKKKKKK